MQNFDLAAKYNLSVEFYSLSLDDNVQATLATGIVALKKPMAVFIVDAALPPTATGLPNVVEGFAWDVDSNNKPRVTAQFSNAVTGVYCQIAVCYKE